MVKPSFIRKIRPSKTYTYKELASVVCKSEATTRAWAKDGLRVLKATKPHLILGSDARAYLNKRFNTKGPKLKIGEAPCFTCKARRMLTVGLAEIRPNSPKGWRMFGLCSVCGAMCSRIIAERDIPFHAKKLGIEITAGIQAYSNKAPLTQTFTSKEQNYDT